MNIKSANELIEILQQDGKVFLYGSTALFMYCKKPLKIINILTDINLARIGQLIPDLRFPSDLHINCYTRLPDNIIITFLIDENMESDDYAYIQQVSLARKKPPGLNWAYSPEKKRYFSLNSAFYNNFKKKIIQINSLDNIPIEGLFDLLLFICDQNIPLKISNKTDYPSLNPDLYAAIRISNDLMFFLEPVLTAQFPYNGLVILEQSGLLSCFFPFLDDLRGIEQDRTLHPEGDAFQHTLHCFRFVKNPSLRLVFGLLLHDYGKSGLNTHKGFRDHTILGSREVKRLLRPYGFNAEFIKEVEFLVEYHMVNSYFFRIDEKERNKIFNNALGQDLLRLFKADTMGSIGKLDVYYDVLSKLKKKIKDVSFY